MTTSQAPTNPATKADRKAEAERWDGYRAASFARSTGTMVVLVQSAEAGIEDDPSLPFTTVCDDHDRLICHETYNAAKGWMSQPEGWCEVCAGTDVDLAQVVADLPVSARAYAKRVPLFPPSLVDARYGWPEGTTDLIRHTDMSADDLSTSVEPQRVDLDDAHRVNMRHP